MSWPPSSGRYAMAKVSGLINCHDPQYTASEEPHPHKVDMNMVRIEELRRELLTNGFDSSRGLIDVAVEEIIWIIEGNHRVAAALEAGIDEIPVHLAQVSSPMPAWTREITFAEIPEVVRPIMTSEQMIRHLAAVHPQQGAEHGLEPPTLSRLEGAGTAYERAVMNPGAINCNWDADPELVAAISESVKLGHEIEPIIIDSVTDSVIDGANRLAAARQLGLEQVPVWRSTFARPTFANSDPDLPTDRIEPDAAHRHIS